MSDNHTAIKKDMYTKKSENFKAELFYIINEEGVKEYFIHCTSMYKDTSIIESGFLLDHAVEENTLELTLMTTISHTAPSLAINKFVHHTIELGEMPMRDLDGVIKIFSMVTAGKRRSFAKTDKKPQGEVRTASAKEKI